MGQGTVEWHLSQITFCKYAVFPLLFKGISLFFHLKTFKNLWKTIVLFMRKSLFFEVVIRGLDGQRSEHDKNNGPAG